MPFGGAFRRRITGAALAAAAVVVPLSVLAAPPQPAAAAQHPQYTVFSLPIVGTGGLLGHDSGLVYSDYQEFQIHDDTDSISQLNVPNDPNYWTDNQTFDAEAMNSDGVFAGATVSGDGQPEQAAIWKDGTVTLAPPAAGFTSPELAAYGGNPHSPDNPGYFVFAPCTPTKNCTNDTISWFDSINDAGQAAGAENYQCSLFNSNNPNGAGGGCSLAMQSDGTTSEVSQAILPDAQQWGGSGCSLASGPYSAGASAITPDGTLVGSAAGLSAAPPDVGEASCFSVTSQLTGELTQTCNSFVASAYNGVLCSSDLGSFTGTDFNSSGVAVGRLLEGASYSSDPYLWQEGQGTTELSTLIGPSSVSLPTPIAIDNDGDILLHSGVVMIDQPPAPPEVDTVSPAAGPVAGGTKVTVTGKDLELAKSATLTFADGRTYVVALSTQNESWDGTSLSFRTPNVSANESPGAIADVTIAGQGGTSAISQSDQFAFTGLTVSNVDADAGPFTNAPPITVTGQGFDGVTGVFFQLPNGLDVGSGGFSVDSNTQLTVTPPSNVQGYYPDATSVLSHVRVSDGSTSSPVNPPGDQYVFGEPVVTSVTTSPCNPPPGGSAPCTGSFKGTVVVLTGSGFTPDSQATFTLQADGDSYPGSVLSVSPDGTSMTVESPDVSGDGATQSDTTMQPPWVADVTVTTPAAESGVTTEDEFAFSTVVVTAVSPTSGPGAGGNTVTISGVGFSDATEVDVVDAPCTGDSYSIPVSSDEFTVVNDNTISFTAPNESSDLSNDYPTSCPGGALATDLIVTSDGNASQLNPSDGYSFGGPVVTSVTASSTGTNQGSVAGGYDLTLTGSGFTGMTSVSLGVYPDGAVPGSNEADSVTIPIDPSSVTSDTTYTLTLNPSDLAALYNDDDFTTYGTGPAGAGKTQLATFAQVTVATDGTSLASAIGSGSAFTLTRPEVDSVTASSTGTNQGSVAGGYDLTLTGSGFTGMTNLFLAIPDPSGGTPPDEVVVGVDPSTITSDTSATVHLSASDLAALYNDDDFKTYGTGPAGAGKTQLAVEAGVFVPDAAAASGYLQSPLAPTVTTNAFTLTRPEVDSVTASSTGTNQGSVAGGYDLTLTGSGFTGMTNLFLAIPDPSGGTPPDEVVVGVDPSTITSDTSATVHLSASDLAALYNDDDFTTYGTGPAGAGKTQLAVEAGVFVPDAAAASGYLQSPLAPTVTTNAFTLTRPEVDSVTASSTGTNQGSVAGGYDLTLTGSGFTGMTNLFLAIPDPSGGTPPDEVVVGVDPSTITSDTSATVHLSASDLAALYNDDDFKTYGTGPAGAGKTQLAVEAGVFVPDAAAASGYLQSPLAPTVTTNAFTLTRPEVDSVTASSTGTNQGSVAGGYDLTLTGSGFTGMTNLFLAIPDPSGGTPPDEVVVGVDPSTITSDTSATVHLSASDLAALYNDDDFKTYGTGPAGAGKTQLAVEAGVFVPDAAAASGYLQSPLAPTVTTNAFTLTTIGVTSADATSFDAGQPGTFVVTTAGATGAVSLSASGALPDGVRFVDDGDGTAVLAGTPASGSAGVYPIDLTATDAVDPVVTQTLTLTVTDAPSPPLDVSATAGTDSATVSWSPPASDGQSPVTGYTVTTSPGGETVNVGPEDSSATLGSLTPGVQYVFSVTATNANGTSDASEPAVAMPTAVAAGASDSDTSESPTGTARTSAVAVPSGATASASAKGAGTVTVAEYGSDPVATLGDGTDYFDVATTPTSAFNEVDVTLCGPGVGGTVEYWDPARQSWTAASSVSSPSGSPGCVQVHVTASSIPSLAELTGTVFAVVDVPVSAVSVSGSFSAYVGLPYAATARALGSDPAFSLAPGAPSWLAIGAASGTLQGRVPLGATSFHYQVVATNPIGRSTSAIVTVRAGKAPTSTHLAVGPAVKVGQAVTLKATVTGPAGVTAPQGTVEFLAAGAPIASCLAQPLVAGSATCTTAFGAPGTVAVGAAYAASASFSGSLAVATQLVSSAKVRPVFASPSVDHVRSGSASSFTITALANPVAKLSCAGTLPKGLRFTATKRGTAVIAGTVAKGTVETVTVTITARNAKGTATQRLTIVVS